MSQLVAFLSLLSSLRSGWMSSYDWAIFETQSDTCPTLEITHIFLARKDFIHIAMTVLH